MDDVVEANAAPAIQLRRDSAHFFTGVGGTARAFIAFILERSSKDVKINVVTEFVIVCLEKMDNNSAGGVKSQIMDII